MKRITAITITLLLTSCATMSRDRPGLHAILGRVDVPRLLDCAQNLPDYKAAAQCLGAEALTQGLRIAMDRALQAAERAREAGHGGGAELSPEDEQAIAADLDTSLDLLGEEIAKTWEPPRMEG